MEHGIIKYLKTGLYNNHGIEKMNKLYRVDNMKKIKNKKNGILIKKKVCGMMIQYMNKII